MGLLICNIAPGAKFRKDTLNTLNFAAKARDIENKVTINERGAHVDLFLIFARLTVPQKRSLSQSLTSLL